MKFLGNPPERQADMERWKKPGITALNVLNTHLTSHQFLVANTYTIADIALFAYTHVADEGGFDLSPFPAILNWLERIKQQPDFVAM